MSQANSELIRRLYVALDTRDGEAMARCYHKEATFRDPVFTLQGERVGWMWRMLTSRAADLRAHASGIEADAEHGKAYWVATYTYSATGRKVENRIHARFRFKEGLIGDQVDTFSFWRWSRQALGPVGLLLGWTPMVQRKVQAKAGEALDRYIESASR
jgi:ketosteroid isomerase-like protein